MKLGVRELKQHLREYLRQVAQGAALQVTDRGVLIAEIRPVAGGDPLSQVIEEGWIRAPLRSGAVGHHDRAQASRRVLDVLGEDRDL